MSRLLTPWPLALLLTACNPDGGSPVKPGVDDTDASEDSADTGKDSADTGKDSADTGKDSADTGKDSADTGETGVIDTSPPWDTDPPPVCPPTDHAIAQTPERWVLPSISTLPDEAFERIGGQVDCPQDATQHARNSVADVTGDGIPDLITLAACDDRNATFLTAFPGHGHGFRQQGIQLTTPDTSAFTGATRRRVRFSTGISPTKVYVECGEDDTLTSVGILADVDGDRFQDVVVYRHCQYDGRDASEGLWVHRGSATGWHEKGESWKISLPEDVPANAFGRGETSRTACAQGGTKSFSWNLADHDGDGRASFLIMDNCDEEGVGTSSWLIHDFVPGGAHTSASWSLPSFERLHPSYASTLRWGQQEQSCDPSTNGVSYQRTLFADVSGDGRPDLLVSETCENGDTVGDDEWRIHLGTQNGLWATPQSWKLPSISWFKDTFFSHFSYSGVSLCSGSGTARYNTRDLDGDGFVDLVFDRECGLTGSPTRQVVYFGRSNGSGFTSIPAYVANPPLPSTVPSDLEWGFAGFTCGGEHFSSYRMDITGDGREDYVVTDACDAAEVGTVSWLVYPGGCTGP